MNRSRDDYIKLYRCIEDSQAFQNPELFKVWVWCLVRANYKDRWLSVKTGRGTTEVFLKRGQFIFGRNEAAKKLKMRPTTLRDRMKKLANMQNLAIQPATHYSIVTVCKYDDYQSRDDSNQQPTRLPTANQPPQTRRYKKVKKDIYGHFDRFWECYPRKVAKIKVKQIWGKLNPSVELIDQIIAAVETQKESAQWQKDGGQYIPNPTTWLNQQRWEDQVSQSGKSSAPILYSEEWWALQEPRLQETFDKPHKIGKYAEVAQ